MQKHHRLVVLIAVLILIGIPVAGGTTFCVNASGTCSGTQYPSITVALALANDYDTIIVGPGLYRERITISKAITLMGATAGVPKKDYNAPTEAENYAHDTAHQSVINPHTADSATIVAITAANVTIDGFIIYNTDAPTPSSVYPATYLINVGGATKQNNITIRNNVLGPNTNLTNRDGNSGRMAITISKHSPTSPREDNIVHNLKIQDNMIYDSKGDGCGILMIGERNLTNSLATRYQFKGAVIDNNTISGNHRSGIDFSGAVQGSPENHIRITNNDISYNGWNSTVDKDAITWGNGIVFLRLTDNQNNETPLASQYVDVENNIFSGNEKNGIYIGPATMNLSIRNNIIQNNGKGSSPAGGAGYNTWDGIRIDLNETYQIQELLLHPEQPQYKGVTFYDSLVNITISENRISGNGGYGLRVMHTPLKGLVDARRNWWGSTSGPQNSLTNPSGTGDGVSTFVRFSPWYSNSEKSATTSAASGDNAVLTVSPVTPGNFTTIQAGINTALSGDTIRVFPGLYDERIVVNKSLTLLGATTGISKKDYVVPAGYGYDLAKESIISPTTALDKPVVQIWNSAVTFDGFIVKFIYSTEYPAIPYPPTDLISINNQSRDYSDVKIVNNVVGPNTNILSQNGKQGRMGIVVPGPYEKTVYNLTIANNKIFNATGDGCGILFLGSQNTGTPALAAKYRGTIIDNNTISGSHRSGIEFSGGVQGSADTAGHIRITSNNITNNGWNSTADKDTVKYGNGIVLTRIGSDISTFNYQFSSAWGPRYVDIDNNLIANNEKNGIYIGPTSQYITITNNILSTNGPGTTGYTAWDGVQVDLDESFQHATDKNYGNLTNILLKSNDILNNGGYGVRVIQIPTLGSIDARNNWWGNASGPNATLTSSVVASRVSDNVVFSPWYTSSIKTSASTLPLPIATFTVNPVEDMAGAPFSFDASASESQSKSAIKSYQWDYGDGNKSAASASPLTSWIFPSSKVYTITLTVRDTNSMINQTTRQVTVIAKKEVVPLVFNGTSVSGTKGNQEIKFDSAKVNGTMSNTTTGVTIKNPGNGWAEMVVVGNTTGDAGGEVTVQNITQVVLKGTPTVTQLDTTPGGAGAVTTSIQLSLKEFADAPLQVAVSEGANATVANAFQLAAGSGNSVDAVAYTMTIQGSSLINSNLSAPVVLNMSVSKSWVDAHGGISALRVIRFSDDGNTKEVLDTRFLFTDAATGMCFVEVLSPHGCSIFGVASVSAVPQASQPSTGYSAGYQSGGGGSDSDSSSPPASQPKGDVKNTAQQGPMDTEKGAPESTKPSSPPEHRSDFQLEVAEGGPVYDRVVTVIVGDDGSPGGIVRAIIAFIVSNIIVITSVITLSIACATLVIWFGERERYWR